MTWLRRARPVLIVLGGLLVVGSLLGARLLAHGSGGGSDGQSPKTAAPQGNGKGGTGLIVTGYVYPKTPMIDYGLPPVLQSGRIAEVFVTEGQEVKKGEKLYAFDASVQEEDVRVAQEQVKVAQAKKREARALEGKHNQQIALQREKIENAELKAKLTKEGYRIYEETLRNTYVKEHGPERAKELMALDPKLFELDTGRQTAARELGYEKAALKALEAIDAGAGVAEAEAAVGQAQAVVKKAQAVVDQCTIKADTDGTIERVSVSAGETLGISTRTPALILVPAGPRIVRAEVEAEFVHRIGPDKLEKEVTITDHFGGKVTYKGVVQKIGTAFLQKRNAADGFGMNDTRVLEVVVAVTDPSPDGKASLKVGQKVRVNFGP